MAANKSPHILINFWLPCIVHNAIIKKNPQEYGKGNARKMFYDIEGIGQNIRYYPVKKYLSLELETISLK